MLKKITKPMTNTMSTAESSQIVTLTDRISYLPATFKPFCCDVVFIRGNDCTWVFDVGTGEKAAEAVNSVQGKKNIVLSHFHPDHIANLPHVSYENLYVSGYTKKYTFSGTVISNPTDFDDIQIVPMPSCHAKGCLAMICGDYAFLGDGAFCKYKGEHHLYNQQVLKTMIEFLEALPCKYVALDHEENFIQHRRSVILIYKDIYSRRKPDEPFINVDDFFNT